MSVKNQFIKITENSNSALQSADSKLDSISKFGVYTGFQGTNSNTNHRQSSGMSSSFMANY